MILPDGTHRESGVFHAIHSHGFSGLSFGMVPVALPVFEVGFGEVLRVDDQEVLRVLLLCRLGGVCRRRCGF
jgi:hypothetical protein